MLIDFRHKPTKDDLMMYTYLRHYNIPVTIVATKVDKISKNKIDKYKKVLKETLNINDDNSLILFSTITKMGKNEVLEKILSSINS